eukprot:m.436815 g.436815  ORF g.436815 m.436815 type:complete len:85 (-) comp56778_c1_seq3:357-611(-)
MKSVAPVVEAAGVKAGIVAQLVASEHAVADQPADAQLLGGTGEHPVVVDGGDSGPTGEGGKENAEDDNERSGRLSAELAGERGG